MATESKRRGRPPVLSDEGKIISAYLSKEAVDWLDRHCETLGLKRSEAIRKLLDYHRLKE